MEPRCSEHAITGLEPEFGTIPYFQVVYVRKETTAEQRVGEGSEMVGAKEVMKSEEFSIVQSVPFGSTRGGEM